MTERDDATAGPDYTARLRRLSHSRWKRVVDAQLPYRWNLRRLLPHQRTLDVGCGLGRNLAHLPDGSEGVDHNPFSVRACVAAGLTATTVDDFLSQDPDTVMPFTGLLAAHLVEHLPAGRSAEMLGAYLPYLAPRATVVLICPQERGFASDDTHTVFTDQQGLASLAGALDLNVVRQYSFPLPRFAGRVFTYNEFVTIAVR